MSIICDLSRENKMIKSEKNRNNKKNKIIKIVFSIKYNNQIFNIMNDIIFFNKFIKKNNDIYICIHRLENFLETGNLFFFHLLKKGEIINGKKILKFLKQK